MMLLRDLREELCGVIVQGPNGSGRSQNAWAMVKAMQLRGFLDEWDGKTKLPGHRGPFGLLVLTNAAQIDPTAAAGYIVLSLVQALEIVEGWA